MNETMLMTLTMESITLVIGKEKTGNEIKSKYAYLVENCKEPNTENLVSRRKKFIQYLTVV